MWKEFLALTIVLVCGSVCAETGGMTANIEGRCKYADDAAVEKIEATLSYFDRVLPNVPPEEEKYLSAEEKSLLSDLQEEQESKRSHDLTYRRQESLASRRLYYVWQARKELSKARAKIDVLLLDRKSAGKAWLDGNYNVQLSVYQSEEANKLDRAASIISDVSYLQLSLRDLTIYETARDDTFLTREIFGEFYGSILTLEADLSSFIRCKLAKIAPTGTPGRSPR